MSEMSDHVAVRLLIVEDDQTLREAIAGAVTALLGWTVLTAADPVAAQPHYEAVDVVMTDWNMPLGGGQRVLDESPCPVLIYTAAPVPVDHPHRLRKPASLPTIQMAVLHTLNSARDNMK